MSEGDGYDLASGRKLDEVWDDSTQAPDIVMRTPLPSFFLIYISFSLNFSSHLSPKVNPLLGGSNKPIEQE